MRYLVGLLCVLVGLHALYATGWLLLRVPLSVLSIPFHGLTGWFWLLYHLLRSALANLVELGLAIWVFKTYVTPAA
jgi:hypothetical protein